MALASHAVTDDERALVRDAPVTRLPDRGEGRGHQRVVAKFGGSSVRDAAAIRSCARIVRRNADYRIVVVSAVYDMTNQLEQLAALALESVPDALWLWRSIRTGHDSIARDLGIEERVRPAFAAVEREAIDLIGSIHRGMRITPALMDRMYSLGERMSSPIVAAALGARLIDARTVLKTSADFGRAEPLLPAIDRAAREVLGPLIDHPGELIVTQGFIGATPDGHTTTLGREGSDYTAALLAEAINADALDIWTDVPGIATCDPRLVDKAFFIPSLNYAQASLLAERGAKILFPRTLEPAQRAGVKVFVGSSLDASAGGTRIAGVESNAAGPIAVTAMGCGQRELISLVGQRLDTLSGLDPQRLLEVRAIPCQVHECNARVFSILVERSDKLRALRLLHDYLIQDAGGAVGVLRRETA